MNMTTETKNGKIPFEFTPHFHEKFENSMKLYQMALDKLNDAVHSSTNFEYGYCSNKYSVRLITPNDISTFTSNLIKAFRIGMLQYNIDDVQKFSVESAYRFISEHEDTPFDESNVLGAFSGTYINPKDFTLTDLLTIAHNEVFPTSLKSNYEIGVQKMNIKEDLRKVNDLHFSGVMKNIVKALPGLINRSDSVWQADRMLLHEMFVNAIESFIMFAILLNTCTIVGMTNYVDPTCHYSTRELGDGDKNQVHQESVNTQKNKPVFIVLSEGKTPVLSQAIRAKTKSNFSHASISFDPNLKEMWSYGRPSLNPDGTMNNVKFGFKSENIDERLFRGKHINIGVYAIYLPAKNVHAMEEYIKGYLGMKTKFDWSAMLQQLFSKDKEPNEDKYKRICSTFVDTVLKQTGVNLTGKNSPNPGDFKDVLESGSTNKVIKVFYGDSNNYSPTVARKKLKQFASDRDSVTYESFVTECCLLKTDCSIFRSKIPFGCNFRELVLGDMTDDFKDVKSAMYYIIKNPNSPIAQLLTKYVTVNNICVPDASLVTNMIFKHKEKSFDNSWFNNKTGQRVFEDMYGLNDFHTDVNWLDKIVYGDPAYDGNYRRDNVGNQAVHPIVNTLDTIYHIYGDKRIVGNEEVANHIIGVGNVMLGIISAYKTGEIEDYQMTKDILAVLGEIITRCILKLYHNNTRVIDNTDAMPDAMGPGYMYVEYFNESFVMEDGEAANGNNNKVGGSPTVNIERNNNKSNATNKFRNIRVQLGNLISKFARWISDQLRKISPKFAEKHRLEYKWVKDNDKLNNEIMQSLDSSNLNITVNNFPGYKISTDKLTNVSNYGDKIANALNSNDFKPDTLFKELLPDGLNLTYGKENKESNDLKVQNYVLYGDENYQPSTEATKVTGDKFKELCDNIIGTEEVLKRFSDVSKQLDAASKELEKKCKENPVPESNNNNVSESYIDNAIDSFFVEENTDTPPAPAKEQSQQEKASNAISKATDPQRIKEVFDVVSQVSSAYVTKTTNLLINKFYKDSYSVYRDIVQAYKQEGSSNTEQPATANNNANTNTTEQPATADNEQGGAK